jgi:hypothetical protein
MFFTAMTIQWLKLLEAYKDTCKKKQKNENIFMFNDCTARSEPIRYHHKSIHIFNIYNNYNSPDLMISTRRYQLCHRSKKHFSIKVPKFCKTCSCSLVNNVNVNWYMMVSDRLWSGCAVIEYKYVFVFLFFFTCIFVCLQ